MDKKTERWIYWMNAGHFLGCHQMASRSFSFHGYQFPVCARCTGVIVGELLSVVSILLGIRINFWLMLFLIAIMGIDWGIQRIDICESTNIRRLVTGLSCGFGLTYLYFYIIRFGYYYIIGLFIK